MSEAPEDRFKRLLAQQLEMNPRTWAALEEHGIDERSLLVIDYSFTAPGKKQAKRLYDVLRQRTTFTAEVLREGSRMKPHWRVVGHTRPSTVSVAMLDEWVTFMVTLGAKHGECRFDGWGVQVPDGKPQGSAAEGLQHGFTANGSNGSVPKGD